MRPKLLILTLLFTFAAAPAARACMWDYDTLRDEQRGLPEMSAILAGQWERHSDFFYENRVNEMRSLLAKRPDDLAATDNLAVALEKLGRGDEAIALMRDKLALPDGGPQPHYTTHANLGTFYLHRYKSTGNAAELDCGIGHITAALEINPDAHFGRETYQLQLARHLRDGPAAREHSFVYPLVGERGHYARSATEGRKRELQPAVDGVVGMIRFGTGTSPLLYEALGDLLSARGDKHLAARAYLRALEFDHPDAERVESAFARASGMIAGQDEAELRAAFQAEKAAAADWVTAYQTFEDALVRRGVDTTDAAVYQPFYARHGEPRATLGFSVYDYLPNMPAARLGLFGLTLLGSAVLLLVVLVVLVVRRLRRSRAADRSAFA